MSGGSAVWRSIRSKLVIIYLLLILFATQLIGAYFVRALTASLIRGDTEAAKNQAQLIATIAAPEMRGDGKPPGERTSAIRSYSQLVTGVVYILNKDGVVIDTNAGTALIGQKRIDSVATQALVAREQSVAIRYDSATEQHLLAIAVPIVNQREFLGVVECVVPIQNTYATVRQVTTIFYTGSALVLALTALLGIVLSRTITRPVLDVIQQARKMAAGDFSQRVDVHSDDEFGDLSRAINHLADKLEEALAANTRERERLQAIIKHMGDGVIALDANFQVVFLNDAAQRFLTQIGPNAAEVLGLERALQGGVSDKAFLRTLGKTVLHVHCTAIRKHGEIEGYVAVLRDVTEQEKLQNARRDFVANVSHELRTPLTSIKSYIEALQDHGDDPELREKFLGVIAQETDRMVRLTEDLLQLSGLEMGKATFTESLLDLRQWLEESVQRFSLQAQSRNIDLSLDCPETVQLKGDRDWLDRLLDNLLSNALKFTPAHGHVKVSANLEAEDVHLIVKDDGIGIPAEDLPHVFERFYRVDKARSRRMGGTGLGLALAREIAERHGGTIWLISEIDKGTEVHVRLPKHEEGRS
jgi:two-component system sensor histidine kinase VicK